MSNYGIKDDSNLIQLEMSKKMSESEEYDYSDYGSYAEASPPSPPRRSKPETRRKHRVLRRQRGQASQASQGVSATGSETAYGDHGGYYTSNNGIRGSLSKGGSKQDKGCACKVLFRSQTGVKMTI